MMMNFELETVDNQDFSVVLTIVLYDLKNAEKLRNITFFILIYNKYNIFN